MITKGYIIELPKGNNKYKVRIPIFETANSSFSKKDIIQQSIFEATLCNTPGNNGGYDVGDCVFVGFESNEESKPIILGKLFINPVSDSSNSLYLRNLKVSDKVTFSKNIQFGDLKYENLENTYNRVVILEDKIDSNFTTLDSRLKTLEGKVETSQLVTPVVIISDNGLATWPIIANAIKYEYKIGSTSKFTDLDKRSIQLQSGETIVVRAIGDNVKYFTSNWSVPVTYSTSGILPAVADVLFKGELKLEPRAPVLENLLTLTKLKEYKIINFQFYFGDGSFHQIAFNATFDPDTFKESDENTVVIPVIGSRNDYTSDIYCLRIKASNANDTWYVEAVNVETQAASLSPIHITDIIGVK